MIEIILTHKLTAQIARRWRGARILSARKLQTGEIAAARRAGLRRFFLPALDARQSEEFFREFDRFWDEVIKPFGPNDPFWREPVSSKMQEWERSSGYLALVLFTLRFVAAERPSEIGSPIIVLVDSWEEEDLWHAWAQSSGWTILSSPSPWSRILRRFEQEYKNVLLFGWWTVLALRKKFFSPPVRLPVSGDPKETVLIASLFYPWSLKDGQYLDPFLGDLHRKFAEHGKNCVYLCDFLGKPNAVTQRALRECRDAIINIPHSILSVGQLILVLARVWARRPKFSNVTFGGCDFSRLLAWHARRFAYPFAIMAEVYYTAVSEMCRRQRFERLIFIFEGNVYERACIQAFREQSGEVVDGYSHAVIYLLNLKLHLTPAEIGVRPEADRYLCSGDYARRKLAQIGNRPMEKLVGGCALREMPVLASRVPPTSGNEILVALDGVWSSIHLVDWLTEHAKELSEYRIRIRAHPNVRIENILEHMLYPLPAHIEISRAGLSEDLKRSFCVIYRQTSVGMQALVNGIPSVHLAVDLPLEGDPVAELRSGKWVASDIDQLRRALSQIKSLTELQRAQMIDEAKPFLREYFSSPSEESTRQFIGV